MRKYNVYGFGAALIDTEVRVPEKFLSDSKMVKGGMTLVNQTQQAQLLNQLKSKKLDFIKKCGGSVCNSLVAAASLGARTFFSSKVAADLNGELYVSDLRNSGVDFYTSKRDSGITGQCLVMVTEDAERTMNTFLGISENISTRDINNDALRESEWFYVEGYLVTNENRAAATIDSVGYARKHNVKIAVSLSDPFVVENFGDALRDVIACGVDLIFCNKNEALAFARTDNLESAIKILKRYSKAFIITDGARGALVFDGKSTIRSSAVDTELIDTNGAGDMFAGAFLYALTAGRSFEWSARLANYCAARVVAKFGPRLDADEYISVKQKFNI